MECNWLVQNVCGLHDIFLIIISLNIFVQPRSEVVNAKDLLAEQMNAWECTLIFLLFFIIGGTSKIRFKRR